jgi:hypothetical protein
MRLSFIHLIPVYFMLPNIGATWGSPPPIYFYLGIVFLATELKRLKIKNWSEDRERGVCI